MNERDAAREETHACPRKPRKGRALGIFDEEADEEQESQGWVEGQGRGAYVGDDAGEDDDELDLGGSSADARAEAGETLAVIAEARKDVGAQE